MDRARLVFGWLLIALILLLARAATAQQTYDPAVTPATASAPAGLSPAPADLPPVTPPEPAQLVRFARRAVQVGDLAQQEITLNLDMASRYVQSGQIANESRNVIRREQRRRVEVTAVADERIEAATISFDHSRKQSPENPDPNALAAQPIEGKSYFAQRRQKTMLVTDASGAIPPLEEYELVADVAQNLAKPNPLAPLLLERPIAVGQKILVPREAATAVLGLRDQVGTIKRFELTLTRVEPTPVVANAAAGQSTSEVAVFAARIETLPNETTPMEFTLAGTLAVEVDSCRTVAAHFQGPVQMSTTERTRGGIFQFSAAGDLSVSIRSHYSRVEPKPAGARFPLGFSR